MRYRTVTYYQGSTPIYAELEIEGEGSRTPETILQIRTSTHRGNWIEGEPAPRAIRHSCEACNA